MLSAKSIVFTRTEIACFWSRACVPPPVSSSETSPRFKLSYVCQCQLIWRGVFDAGIALTVFWANVLLRRCRTFASTSVPDLAGCFHRENHGPTLDMIGKRFTYSGANEGKAISDSQIECQLVVTSPLQIRWHWRSPQFVKVGLRWQRHPSNWRRLSAG